VGGDLVNHTDPMGLKEFLQQCKGRYATCAVTQDKNASAIGNYLRLKVCKQSVNVACKTGFPMCCDTESQECYAKAAGDPAATAKCTAAHLRCMLKGN